MGVLVLVLAAALLGGSAWAFVTKRWILGAGALTLLAALIVWIAVLLNSVRCTYVYAGTRYGMVQVGEALRVYHTTYGSFPAVLEVNELGDQPLPRPTDGYGYELTLTEHSFLLKSWGRDRKPGGERFDQDIHVSWKSGEKALSVESAAISP